MKIQITTTYESAAYWGSKTYGAIFVKNKDHIHTVLSYLVEKDGDWEYYAKLVQPLPAYSTINDLNRKCGYTGKTLICDMVAFMRDMENQGIEIFVLINNENSNL